MTETTESGFEGRPSQPGRWPEYQAGEVIGRKYQVLDVRRGGMGLVYIVDDLTSRRQDIQLRLALKTFQGRYLWDSQAISRFVREALHWVRLGPHPHIVHALVVEEIEGRPYLWLEYVDGDSLAERLRQGPLTVPEALDFSLQFVDGLRHAHEKHGLLHRDIKPGNLLLTRAEVLKITDFGLAKVQAELAQDANRQATQAGAQDPEQTQSEMFATGPNALVGTPAYMPPEAILNPSQVDVRGDIYSFGLVLYEMLSGRRAFHGPRILEQHLHHRPAPLRTERPEVPAALDELVLKCLEKDPERRFHSLGEFEEALTGVAKGLPAGVRVSAPTNQAVPAKGQWFMQAHTLMVFGRLEEAIECYTRAIELDPNQAEFYNNLAVCLSRLGRMEEAAAKVEKAVALRPGYAEAWANLGGFCASLGQYERGLKASERAVELKPDWAEGHANQGANLLGLGRHEEAGACFERALRADPHYWRAYLMAAEGAARRGEPAAEILPLLEQALAINPRAAGVLAFKAACLDALGRRDEAERQLELAREVNPHDRLVQQIQQLFARKHHKGGNSHGGDSMP